MTEFVLELIVRTRHVCSNEQMVSCKDWLIGMLCLDVVFECKNWHVIMVEERMKCDDLAFSWNMLLKIK